MIRALLVANALLALHLVAPHGYARPAPATVCFASSSGCGRPVQHVVCFAQDTFCTKRMHPMFVVPRDPSPRP